MFNSAIVGIIQEWINKLKDDPNSPSNNIAITYEDVMEKLTGFEKKFMVCHNISEKWSKILPYFTFSIKIIEDQLHIDFNYINTNESINIDMGNKSNVKDAFYLHVKYKDITLTDTEYFKLNNDSDKKQITIITDTTLLLIDIMKILIPTKINGQARCHCVPVM